MGENIPEGFPVTSGSYGIDCASGPCGGADIPGNQNWGMEYGQQIAQQARENAQQIAQQARENAHVEQHDLDIPYLNHETSTGTFYICDLRVAFRTTHM